MLNYGRGVDLRRMFYREGCPGTFSLLIAAVVLFLGGTFGLSPGTLSWILFSPTHWITRPWTLVTGSLLSGDPLNLLFGVAWLWLMGGSVERSLGTRPFLAIWAALSAIIGLGLWAGWLATGREGTLYLFAVLDAITVVWALLNRGQVVMLMFVLPVSAITLAIICAVFTLVTYGLPLGFFALSGCAAAWAWMTYRFRLRRFQGVTRIPARRKVRDESAGPVERLQAWQRDRRMKKLFRDSGVDGRDPLSRR